MRKFIPITLVCIVIALLPIASYGVIPNAPFNLIVTSVTSNQVNLSWTDNSNDENGFAIHRLANCSYVQIGVVGPNVTTFSDPTVTQGATYSYKVRSFNSSGSSPLSNVVVITVPTGPTPTPTATPSPTPTPTPTATPTITPPPTPTPTPTPTPSPTPTPTPTATPTSPRYALSHDGNFHDHDDIDSLPLAIALFSKTGHASQVVYIEHSNHYWLNNAGQETNMIQSAILNTTGTWGGFTNVQVFNDHLSNNTVNPAAITALKNAMLASTAASPLYIMAGGPMQTIGLALAAANLVDPTRAKYVTIISHSSWNDTHAGNVGPGEGLPPPRYNYSAFPGMGANTIHIVDQNGDNAGSHISGTFTQYAWLNGTGDPKLQWLWDAGQRAGKTWYDCSDAGMTYYILFNDTDGTPTKVKAVLTAP